ncbi:MAG: rhomboid family intramembrane serine protease [Deltaproteobacteria bacterium]|nr:MAG: rhomboid family intramembrane serine protease [Deltaproteobacteria bacterium]
MLPIRDTIPHRNFPLVNWAIILTNCVVFFFELGLPAGELRALFYYFGIVPARYTHPEWAVWLGLPVGDLWPFVTSMFLHGGWAHLIMNMWALWIFGDNVEDRMGHLRYLVFYLLCGVASGVAHYVVNAHSTLPTVGASGAISGVMGAYMLMFPRSRVIVLVPFFFLPMFIEVLASLYIFLWFVGQFMSGTFSVALPGEVGGVAWWAHIGGFVAGMLLMPWLRPRRRRRRLADDEWGLLGAWGGGRRYDW